MENRYSINTQVEGIVEKQRYTAVEKAKRILALQSRIEEAQGLVKQDMLEAVADIIAVAKLSNSTEVVKFVNTLEAKLTKLLG